jgi:hypothetical protein
MDLASIVFTPIALISVLLLAFVALGGYFTWLEIRRKSSTVAIRIVAVWIALLALLGLVTRPSWQSEVAAQPVAVLTKGYDKSAVDSLKKLHNNFVLLQTEESVPYPDATRISISDLQKYASHVKAVFGEGLPPYLFDIIPDADFYYRPSSMSRGITALQTEPYFVSHQGIIKGKVKNAYANSKLILRGPGGAEDSLTFKKSGETSFSLKFTPRQSGNFLYQFVASDSSSHQTEMVPLTIQPERKLNVLFLQQFPSAEIRYLKNFLADHGHGVVLRYTISQDRFRYEFGNHKTQKIDHITNNLLNDFDLLIVTTNDLKNLNAAERKSIEESVRSGLGLIILLEEIPDEGSLQPLLQIAFQKTTTDTVQVVFNSGKQTLSCLQASLSTRKATQSISTSSDKKILSGYQFMGLGKTGFQSLRETYALSLKDLPELYSEIWTPLIEQVARNSESPYKISLDRQPPYFANDPLSVTVISSGEKPRMTMDQTPVPTAEDIFTDDLWHGKIWVGQPGWHQLRINGDSSAFNFYISSGEAGSSALSLANQIEINGAHAADQGDFTLTDAVSETHQISIWVYFILFLAASAYLWLEPRI